MLATWKGLEPALSPGGGWQGGGRHAGNLSGLGRHGGGGGFEAGDLAGVDVCQLAGDLAADGAGGRLDIGTLCTRQLA